MPSTNASPEVDGQQSHGLDGLASAVLAAHSDPAYEAIAESRPSNAPRARLAVALSSSRRRADHRTERARALELGRALIDGHLDLDRGIRLWRRALTLEFDPRLQRELARRLRILGRHQEAGDLLRSGDVLDEPVVAAALRAAASAYTAAGDAEAAITALREAANLEPSEPATLVQLASISAWAPEVVDALDASNALAQAAARSKAGSPQATQALTCAFAVLPKNARAAQDYANLLSSQGRFAAADVVWRQHGVAAQTVGRIAAQRVKTALNRHTPALALMAALDNCIGESDPTRLELLCSVLEHDALRPLRTSDGSALVKLSAAAAVKSSMGRATAFQSVAESLAGPWRAVVSCLAAEAFWAAGNHRRALQSARQACDEAPHLAHPHAIILAMASDGAGFPGALIERAIGLVPASADNYRVAASHFSSEGAHVLALAYARRWLALAPGSELALRGLLTAALATASPNAVSGALEAACEAPISLATLADELRRALELLLDQSPGQAAEAARRLMEVVGATEEMLWPTLHSVAQAAGDDALRIALLCGSACDASLPAHRAAELRLSVATHLSRSNNWQAAAEHLLHAALFNIDDDAVALLLAQLRTQQKSSDSANSGDGLLALAHIEALIAERQNAATVSFAWRQLGALRWDLAKQAEEAESAFFRACPHQKYGAFTYLSDLIDRLGIDRALEMAVARTEQDLASSDVSTRAELLTWVARIAIRDSQQDAALTAALRAIELAPQSARLAVAIVEQLCDHPRGADAIGRAYAIIAEAAAGPTGKDTAQRRAARWKAWFTDTDSVDAAVSSPGASSIPPDSIPPRPQNRRPPDDADGLSLRGLAWGDSVPPPPVATKRAASRGLRSLAWGSRPPPQSASPPDSLPPNDSLPPAASVAAPESAPPPPSSQPPCTEPLPSSGQALLGRLQLHQTAKDTPAAQQRPSSAGPAPPSEIPGPPSQPPPHVAWAPQATSPAEEALLTELTAGSYEAGDNLVKIYADSQEPRLRDTVAVRRLQAMQRRGDRDALIGLRDAAAANNEHAYVQAIEQVIGVLDGDTSSPPALTTLRYQPAITTTLLTGDLDGTVNEALSIVWHSGLMRRGVGDYDLSGTDRVPIGSSTVVGDVFNALGRVLDLSNVRLFHQNRDGGPLHSRIALVNPLAIILSGVAKRTTRTLRYRLGQAVGAAMPQLALTAGLENQQLEDLLTALRTGFGPVGRSSAQNITAAQMRLARDLWQVVGSDGERRLRQICEDIESISAREARGNMTRIQRRIGLFAAGDAYVALSETLAAFDVPGGMAMLRAGDAKLWNQSAIADLFDIAIAPQFAAARWQTTS